MEEMIMPVYKNKKNGKWFCKFYYKDWQGVSRQKKKKGFLLNGKQKSLKENFNENPKQTAPCFSAIWSNSIWKTVKTG